MAVKILAVDDSATMRTILQMTFAGEDAEVVSVGSADDAMARLGEVAPDVMLVDGALASVDGYELTKRAKGASGDLAVVLLSSQHHPFDEARGSDAGVDAHLDKPFDTQRLIDLVGSTLKGARKAPVGAAASPPAAPPAPAGGEIPGVRPAPRSLKRTMAFGAPVGIKPPSVAPGAPAQPPAQPKAPSAPKAPAAAKPPAAPPAQPRVAKPTPPAQPAVSAPAKPAQPVASKPGPAQPVAATPSTTQPVAAKVEAAVGTQLDGMGLTPAQAEAVMALTKDVVERVVWEVVPDLAETIIREEIKRLTAS